MHWTLKYAGKHAAQKALGTVPYGFRVQEMVKRAARRSGPFITIEYVQRRLQTKVDRFNAAGIEPPETVVEQGTGWLGLDLVLLYLAGAQRILTYDTLPWLRTDLLRSNAAAVAAATDIVKRWRGSVPGHVDDRAERLRDSLDCPHETLLERLGVTALVTRSMDRSAISSTSVDLFYSDSVLQFMAPRDLAVLVRHARRFLRLSGRYLHVVDCFDCHAQADPRVPPLAYLAWPEPAWNLLTSKYLNYQNRWRMSQFVKLFENEGFTARTIDPVVDAADVAYVQRRLARAKRFNYMSPEDVATRSFLLTGAAA